MGDLELHYEILDPMEVLMEEIRHPPVDVVDIPSIHRVLFSIQPVVFSPDF